MTMTHYERLWTIVALVAVAIVFAVTALVAMQRRARLRRAALKERFGPEYDRAVEQLGNPARAERELAYRAERVDHFRFHDLSAADRRLFTESWRSIQLKFVDEPAVAVTSANELINQVMRARGYPVEHFEQRVADLSVEHPNVIQHYRAAHELSRSVHNGTVDTEQLRQALVHYRMLFTDLLQEGAGAPVPLDYRRAHAS
jgi:hypothetical protein